MTDIERFLILAQTTLSQYANGDFHNTQVHATLNIVQICSKYLTAYKTWVFRNFDASINQNNILENHEKVQLAWQALWGSMCNALNYYWDTQTWEHSDAFFAIFDIPSLSSDEYFTQDCELANQCLLMIENIREIANKNITLASESWKGPAVAGSRPTPRTFLRLSR